jgi:hypothetical protein
MEMISNEANADVTAWLPHGKGFVIYKKKKFASDILPHYFKQSKYTSFTRKLNRWGFTRVTRGPETGAYYHKYFQRGEMRLCMQMSCTPPKGSSGGGGGIAAGYPLYGTTPFMPDQNLIRQQLLQLQTQQLLLQQQQQHQQQPQFAATQQHHAQQQMQLFPQAILDGKPGDKNEMQQFAAMQQQHHAQQQMQLFPQAKVDGKPGDTNEMQQMRQLQLQQMAMQQQLQHQRQIQVAHLFRHGMTANNKPGEERDEKDEMQQLQLQQMAMHQQMQAAHQLSGNPGNTYRQPLQQAQQGLMPALPSNVLGQASASQNGGLMPPNALGGAYGAAATNGPSTKSSAEGETAAV